MENQYRNLDIAMHVDSKDQLKASEYVSVSGHNKADLKVMFVGNSITLHGIRPEVGWYNLWGMAASEESKDYVHLCYRHILQTFPNAQYCICQASEWEMQYRSGNDLLAKYEDARAFCADVIIVKLSANCPRKDFDEAVFLKNYGTLLDYLDKTGRAKFIIATDFYTHPADAMIEKYARERGLAFCALNDLAEIDEMKALGLFAHEGVANHPGDHGMQEIANRICQIFDRIVPNKYSQLP